LIYRTGLAVPKFLVVHTLPVPMTVEQVTPVGKIAKANVTLDAYWVRSWAQCDNEGKIVKIYCEWNAVDAESIHRILAKTPELPVDGVYPMMIVDSEDFR